MGHTIGLYWSYSRGYISSYRTSMPYDYLSGHGGPILQVSIPIWKGNSGGGLFDNAGQLVGICVTVSTVAPNIAFVVPPVTIHNFLMEKAKK